MSYGIATERAFRFFIAPLHNAAPTNKASETTEQSKEEEEVRSGMMTERRGRGGGVLQ